MSKIHNMIRTLGMPGSEEFELPAGWTLCHTVYLGPTTDQEKAAGFFKVLYVLIPLPADSGATVVKSHHKKAELPADE